MNCETTLPLKDTTVNSTTKTTTTTTNNATAGMTSSGESTSSQSCKAKKYQQSCQIMLKNCKKTQNIKQGMF